MAVEFMLKDELLIKHNNPDHSMNSIKKSICEKFSNQDRLAVYSIDISNFRFYNYKFGYDYGDKILETVENKVLQILRSKGYVYKSGGDILLVLLDKISNKNEARVIAEEISNEFNDTLFVGGNQLRISINMGISMYPEDCEDVEDLLKFSEIALNYSKKCYGDKYKFFEQAMYDEIISKGKLEEDLVNAIYNKEFTLYYQPQIDINTMKIYGMEALLRWNHPEYGVLLPGEFIDIVEENGMIKDIGKFVLEEGCKQIKKWHNLGYNDLSISINLSEKQLTDGSFPIFLDKVLKKNHLAPKYVELEITERILINPTNNILDVLVSLRNLGMRILIDDFGTKYSSLNYLYCFPVDGIKVDKSFVDRIVYSEREFIITKSIVNLAHELKLEVIAEGVEQDEQLEKLKDINCTKIQGFIFGKPIKPKEATNLLMEFNK